MALFPVSAMYTFAQLIDGEARGSLNCTFVWHLRTVLSPQSFVRNEATLSLMRIALEKIGHNVALRLLVFRRSFHMIDHQNLGRAFPGFQFQTKLFQFSPLHPTARPLGTNTT